MVSDIIIRKKVLSFVIGFIFISLIFSLIGFVSANSGTLDHPAGPGSFVGGGHLIVGHSSNSSLSVKCLNYAVIVGSGGSEGAQLILVDSNGNYVFKPEFEPVYNKCVGDFIWTASCSDRLDAIKVMYTNCGQGRTCREELLHHPKCVEICKQTGDGAFPFNPDGSLNLANGLLSKCEGNAWSTAACNDEGIPYYVSHQDCGSLVCEKLPGEYPGCVPRTSCNTNPSACDDNNACTTDSCDASSGSEQCTNTPIPNCGEGCPPGQRQDPYAGPGIVSCVNNCYPCQSDDPIKGLCAVYDDSQCSSGEICGTNGCVSNHVPCDGSCDLTTKYCDTRTNQCINNPDSGGDTSAYTNVVTLGGIWSCNSWNPFC